MISILIFLLWVAVVLIIIGALAYSANLFDTEEANTVDAVAYSITGSFILGNRIYLRILEIKNKEISKHDTSDVEGAEK